MSNDVKLNPITRVLRILLLEDQVTDAELAQRELQRAGLRFTSQRVETRAEFESALDQSAPDLIISDFSLPSAFDGLAALEIARRKCPEVPFVFVSGTIGEERAVEAMKRGATDYVLKDRLNRLVPVIKRALHEVEERAARRRAEEEISRQRAFLRQVIDLDRNFIFAKDREGRFVLVNRAVADAYGTTVEELLGKTDADFNPNAEEVEHFHRLDLEVMDTLREVFIPEEKITDAAGKVRWLQTIKRPIVSENGTADMVLGVATDITERKMQEQRIARLSRIHAVLSGINALIVRARDRQRLLEEACEIAVRAGGFRMAWIGFVDPQTLAVKPAATAGHEEGYLQIIRPSANPDAPEGQGIAGRAIRTKHPVVLEDYADRPEVVHGEEALARGYRSAIALPLALEDEAIGVMCIYAGEAGVFDDEELKLLNELAGDVSFALDHIEKEERLNYLAYYDALTGLPNRSLFYEHVNHLIQVAQQGHSMLALVQFNVQRFRMINDTLGRQAGDALLKLIAERMRESYGERGWQARISADTFAVALPDIKQEADIAHALEERVLRELSRPFTIADNELRIAIRCGIALFPGDGSDTDSLFRNAEAALKKAKDSGERYLFYEPRMNARVEEQLSLENRLRVALIDEQFILHYQPKVEISTGRVVGLEALIRWNSPEMGMVSPAEFIPLLEETGMILEVGRWALKRATMDYAAWRAKGLTPPRIAVNVSAIQLQQKDFVESVRTALAAGGGDADCIELEITESMIMEDLDSNIRKLTEIRAAGMPIAIDDFGTGYSSLGYLVRLPVTSLKIDRSFIVEMENQPDQMTIVSTIISLAHALNLKVVAEGVETKEQWKLLKLLKCDELQGYVFSRPLPPEQVEAIFDK